MTERFFDDATPADPLVIAAGWHSAGEEVAIATVTKTWGSSPCPAGSRLVVTRSGRIAGSVSGGCVEIEVIGRAQEVMDSGIPQIASFNVSDQSVWSVGLACGGSLEVIIEPLAARRSA